MGFAIYKHNIKTSTDTITGNAGLAINNNFKAIGDLFDTVITSSGGTITGTLNVTTINSTASPLAISCSNGITLSGGGGSSPGVQTSSGNIIDDGTGNQTTTGNLTVDGSITGSPTLKTIKGVTIDGNGSVIPNGTIAATQIPFNATIANWAVVSQDGTSGSISVDIQTVTAGSYVPNSASGAVAVVSTGTKPFLSSSAYGHAAPSGWITTQVSAGNYLIFIVSGVSNVTTIRIELTLTPR